jgi:hypothetical protein
MLDIIQLNLINYGVDLHHLDINKDIILNSQLFKFQSYIMFKQDKIKLELKLQIEICS